MLRVTQVWGVSLLCWERGHWGRCKDGTDIRRSELVARLPTERFDMLVRSLQWKESSWNNKDKWESCCWLEQQQQQQRRTRKCNDQQSALWNDVVVFGVLFVVNLFRSFFSPVHLETRVLQYLPADATTRRSDEKKLHPKESAGPTNLKSTIQSISHQPSLPNSHIKTNTKDPPLLTCHFLFSGWESLSSYQRERKAQKLDQ